VAAAEFDIPELKDDIEIPKVKPGSMAHAKSFLANQAVQDAMGYPHELGEDWHERALEKMGDLLGKYRSLKVFLDACVHCGACTDKCHYYLGTSDPKNMPVARQDLMRQVYRRYFTTAGKLFPEAGRRQGPDQGSAGRLVQLLSPVFGMSSLLGFLPLWHRYR
jgi:ferredoxin